MRRRIITGVEALSRKTSAWLWIQDDIFANKTLRKSPAYYDQALDEEDVRCERSSYCSP
jgi:hypothetical protein